MSSLYCRLFIDCELNRDQLTKEAAAISCGKISRFTISSGWGEIDIRENDDWDDTKTENQEGFLFYRFSNDVEPNETIARDCYVTGVIELINGLRSLGCKVVPACDFEDEID